MTTPSCDEGVTAPICPACGRTAETVKTRHGPRHMCCGLHSWRGKPLADQTTHDLRRIAHAAIDPLWQQHGFTRKEVYKKLAEELGITGEECHISIMWPARLRRVIDAAGNIKARGPDKGSGPSPAICQCGNFVSKSNREAGVLKCGACLKAEAAP